jgi:hypothetical protein
MALVDRAKNILVSPKTEWPVIAAETETVQSLYTGYIVILSAIGPLAMMVRGNVIAGVVAYAIGLVVTYVLALIVDALAPTFGGEKNLIASLKLVAYSYTAAWVAGIFQLLPVLGGVIGLLATLYSFYTFYLGVPVLKKSPPEKALGYTIVVVLCAIALGVVLAAVLMSLFVGSAGLAGMGMMQP